MEEEEEAVLAPALVSLHPERQCVVVAVGPELRIFNLHEKSPVYIEDGSRHEDVIRAIRFDREGKLFVSAGDDKLVKIWDASTWLCVKTLRANKKVSSAAFSHDSRWLLYADKFGVVHAVSATLDKNIAADDQPVQLLAHCCSIITNLDCSADGGLIVSADRDFKIRLSIFPKNPLKGAHEILGFCLGHTSFVSCFSFVGSHQQMLLVTGGGDGTVRLWSLETAVLLDTFAVGGEAGLEDGNSIEDSQRSFAVTCISVSNDGSLVAVGFESLDGVLLLRCDRKLKKLLFFQTVGISEHFCPTSLQFDKAGSLWMVAGAAQKLEDQGKKSVTWVKVVSMTLLSPSDGTHEFKPVDIEALGGGALLLAKLEGDQVDFEKALALADAANIAVKNHLLKRQYTHEHREFRKRMRNDRKLQR